MEACKDEKEREMVMKLLVKHRKAEERKAKQAAKKKAEEEDRKRIEEEERKEQEAELRRAEEKKNEEEARARLQKRSYDTNRIVSPPYLRYYVKRLAKAF